MPAAHDLALLRDAAVEAGRIALRFFRGSFAVEEKPGGQGPVSEADHAIDRMLREELCAARPDYGWLSEETPDNPARLTARRVFILDPIDGTRAFISGNSSFAIALALVEDGIPIAGVVHMPARDLTFHAAKGKGAFRNNEPMQVSRAGDPDDCDIVAGRNNIAPHLWTGPPPQFRRHMRPSLAYRLALVAQGRFDGMLSLRPTWEWDVAAGALLVTEAGGTVRTAGQNAPRFNSPQALQPGLLAGAPALVTALEARIAPQCRTALERATSDLNARNLS